LPQHQNKEQPALTKEKKQGMAVTVVIHILLVLFLMLASFKVRPTMPVEVEEGLLVNFGFDETGEGLFEPAPVAEAVPSPPAAGETTEDDAILTQEFEEAPEVKKNEPTAEELKRIEEARTAEVKRRQEAEAEKRRIAEENAERIRREEEERRAKQINDRTKNAFGNAGNVGTSGASEGVAGGEGNQGVETGTPGAPKYGPGGGPGNGAPSYRLGDRKVQSLPVPRYDSQAEGIVVVEISVDRKGNVTKADAGVKGSTTLDEYLLREAHDAAMKAKFDGKEDAPLLQKGFIYYNFRLR
jgi:outer membrane biosynthesis protein TonB